MPRLLTVLLIISATALFTPCESSARLHPSYSEHAVVDTVPYYDTSEYDQSVPAPNDYLMQPVGQLPSWHYEAAAYFQALAAGSERAILEPHGRTHEGRELFHLIVSTPENLKNLDLHRAAMDRVAEPGMIASDDELKRITADLPATAWMAYSIHGDEVSGTDAAIRLAWHLAAAQDSATMHLLENVIVVIDPCENPDGRERYLAMLQTYDSHVENYDAASMQHSGVWPWGRTNHYWFDLNRDWILLTQPETRGRVETIVKYHPVLMVDGHEMGAKATFLFSPPRQPINYNTPDNVLRWYGTFAKDQAAAFDRNGWAYYTGEWNDQWYVGYASAWPTLFGTVGILYEQAGVDGEAVKQGADYLLTYHEATNHQFTSSLANLTTVADNRVDMLRDYAKARAAIVDNGKRSGLTFLFAPEPDRLRMNRFLSSLISQGIRVEKAAEAFTVGSAIDPYHEKHTGMKFPAGTYIVRTAQPHGALAKAILEFDLHLKKEFLDEERRELEKYGDTKMYEVSAWSVPLAYDLDAYYTTSGISVATESVSEPEAPVGQLINPSAGYGFVIDMEGETTYRMLNRLFGEQLTVFASEKPFTIEGRSYRAGALVLRRRGNPDALPATLERLAGEVGINVYGVSTGYSSKGSHLGAPTFRLLRQPRVALAAGTPLDYTMTGQLWFTIDKQLEMPHSLVSAQRLGRMDLSAYNVLILPGAWGGGMDDLLGKGGKSRLQDWVRDGGTLILAGSSTEWAADTATGLSGVRMRRQVLDKLSEYTVALDRELVAEAPDVDTLALWHPDKIPAEATADEKPSGSGKGGDIKALDRWNTRFHPRGVIMRADLDTEDWMTFGLGASVPVMVYTQTALMSKAPVKTVARFCADPNRLRMSGLLWPEARERWAGTAYTTRERNGKGQVIMFLSNPNMRAYFYGTRTMFVNAVMYGPGFTRGDDDYAEQQ